MANAQASRARTYPKSDWALPLIAEVFEGRPSLAKQLDQLRVTAVIIAQGAMLAYFRHSLNLADLHDPRVDAKKIFVTGKHFIGVQTYDGDRFVDIDVAEGKATIYIMPGQWHEAVLVVAAGWIGSILNPDRTVMIVMHGCRYSINDGQILIQAEPSPMK